MDVYERANKTTNDSVVVSENVLVKSNDGKNSHSNKNQRDIIAKCDENIEGIKGNDNVDFYPLEASKKIASDSIINSTKKIVKATVIEDDSLDFTSLSFSFDDCNCVTKIKREELSSFNLVEECLCRELDVYFEQSLEKLNDLKTEQDVIIKDLTNIFEGDGLDDEEKLLDDLLVKLERIRKQFQLLYDSLNFDQIYQLGNNYFEKLVNKYADILDNDIIIEKQLDTIRGSGMYLEIVKSIREIEEENLSLSLFCKTKKVEYENRDKDFSLISNKILEIDDISKCVSTFINEEEKIIADLSWKIKNSVSMYEQVQYIVEENNHALRNLLMVVATANFIDNKGLKTAFLVGETFRFMNALMNPKVIEQKTLKFEVIDYTSEIKSALNDVSSVKGQLVDMKSQVKDIYSYFERNFKEYIDVIPEYKEVLGKLQLITTIIDEQCELIDVSNQELEEEYVNNYEKIKLKQEY